MGIRNFLKRLSQRRTEQAETPDEMIFGLGGKHDLTPEEVGQLCRVAKRDNWRQAVEDELYAIQTRRRLANRSHQATLGELTRARLKTRAEVRACRRDRDDGMGGIDAIGPSDAPDIGWFTTGDPSPASNPHTGTSNDTTSAGAGDYSGGGGDYGSSSSASDCGSSGDDGSSGGCD